MLVGICKAVSQHMELELFLGTSAEEFISRKGSGLSKKEKFHKLLSDVLQINPENVDIVMVMDYGPFLDVRYSAHGSPYYQASQLDSVIVKEQKKVRQ